MFPRHHPDLFKYKKRKLKHSGKYPNSKDCHMGGDLTPPEFIDPSGVRYIRDQNDKLISVVTPEPFIKEKPFVSVRPREPIDNSPLSSPQPTHSLPSDNNKLQSFKKYRITQYKSLAANQHLCIIYYNIFYQVFICNNIYFHITYS